MAVQISIEKGNYNVPKIVLTGDAIDLDQTYTVGTKKQFDDLKTMVDGGAMAKIELTAAIGDGQHKYRGMCILNTFADGMEFVAFTLVADSVPSANLWAVHGDMYLDESNNFKIDFNMTDLT